MEPDGYDLVSCGELIACCSFNAFWVLWTFQNKYANKAPSTTPPATPTPMPILAPVPSSESTFEVSGAALGEDSGVVGANEIVEDVNAVFVDETVEDDEVDDVVDVIEVSTPGRIIN
ncbi:hypothetical protein EKO27_g9655 [Xylaria grammica]|uniref:Uncharacterized protein n=1 Tax=Xylaria grammica TaxID=363999 RepID=A0A439CTF7_9PEZI|nr:hypothetical protein EKO27_g9655 [Xylaria grammica]